MGDREKTKDAISGPPKLCPSVIRATNGVRHDTGYVATSLEQLVTDNAGIASFCGAA